MDEERGTITFMQRPDGLYIVGEWPEEAEFSEELLHIAGPELQYILPDTIQISLVNGIRHYKIIGKYARRGTVIARMVEGTDLRRRLH